MANNLSDGIIDRWAEEAVDDLGEKGWREIESNSMILITYAAQRSQQGKLTKKITTPLWWLLGTVGTGVVWFIISGVVNIH
ncbi:hypothetical protein ES707_13996 [subsurface metagenome]